MFEVSTGEITGRNATVPHTWSTENINSIIGAHYAYLPRGYVACNSSREKNNVRYRWLLVCAALGVGESSSSILQCTEYGFGLVGYLKQIGRFRG